MKSEHRHELKTNDLAKHLITTQDYVQRYGGRVALGIAIVILVIVLINQRIASGRKQEQDLRNDLAYARGEIQRLDDIDFMGRPAVKPADVEMARTLLQRVRDNASDKTLQAEALYWLGEYAWGIANYPDPAGAATQPSARLDKERAEALNEAKGAYQQVVDKYGDQRLAVVSARFGLAAVAENERNWDEAKKQYEAIKTHDGAAESFKRLADQKLKRLEEIRQPFLVGQVPDRPELPPLPTPPTTGTTVPTTGTTAAPTTGAATTAPSATAPAAGAATRPTGRATTRPTTAP
jgi:hypothetical protein